MKLAVLGPGGVGGFVSAALWRAGYETVVVARQALDGISVDSVRLGRLVARPRVVTELVEPVDVLIVATKATTLDAALERVHAEVGAVLPLLNGLDHLAVLRRRFGDRVIPASIRMRSGVRSRHRDALVACIREGAAVADAEGASVSAEEVLAQLDAAHPTLSSSMARDIEAGAEPELDAIAGGVLRAGRRHGVECPTVAALATQVAGRAGVPTP